MTPLTTENRPVYLVERQPYRGVVRWRIQHFLRPSDSIGAVVGHYPTRKQALVCARLLAGRRASVVIWKGM